MYANHHSANKLPYWTAMLLAVFFLTLAACGESNLAMPVTLDTAAPSPAPASCLVGKWQVSDFTSYFNSVTSGVTSASKSDVTVTNKGVTGDLWFTFNSDGTAEVSGDNFNQNFDMTASGLDIPVSVTVSGTAQAKYTISADQITFSDQQPGDMQISVTVMGSTTNATDVFFGQAGSDTQDLYTCPDVNTLTLKVVTSSLDFTPITLTRVP